MTPPLIFNKKEEETEKLTFRSTNTEKKNKGIEVDTHTITKEEKVNINKTCFVKEQ